MTPKGNQGSPLTPPFLGEGGLKGERTNIKEGINIKDG